MNWMERLRLKLEAHQAHERAQRALTPRPRWLRDPTDRSGLLSKELAKWTVEDLEELAEIFHEQASELPTEDLAINNGPWNDED